MCRILDLKRDKYCNDFTSGGKSFQSFTDDGINELANISVRPAMILYLMQSKEGNVNDC